MEERNNLRLAAYAILTGFALVLILCGFVACGQMTALADEPKQIMNGEYIIAEIHTQDGALEIDEAPPINEVSKSLEVVDKIDDTPYCSEVPLDAGLQKYIWEKCKASTSDYKNLYSFMIGLIDQESEFNPRAVSRTHDYGLTQTNRKWVFPDVKKVFGLSDITDCFDPYVSIDCCFWELSKKLNSYGVSERLYYFYNTGSTSGSSNKNSRSMKKKWAKWDAIIWG